VGTAPADLSDRAQHVTRQQATQHACQTSLAITETRLLGDSTCVRIFLGVRGEGGVSVQAPAKGDALQRLHVRVAVHAHLCPRAHKALKHPDSIHAMCVHARR